MDGKVRINYFGAGLDSLRGRRGKRPENVESFTVTRLDWMACIFMICTNRKTEIKRGMDEGTGERNKGKGEKMKRWGWGVKHMRVEKTKVQIQIRDAAKRKTHSS